LPGAAYRFSSVSRRQFPIDALQVGFNGVHRDVQLTSYLGGAEHPGQEGEHFTFAPAELLDDHWCRLFGSEWLSPAVADEAWLKQVPVGVGKLWVAP
jgi:hypothetical protein